ncbi:hypothetical protein [Shewanella indica]|uniref:hypothetical protein n=1 Tax=Shewanella indica TaxID=768528 RepID=UPI001CFF0DCD|nr:hypothetical protein [Shewanella indica]
MAQSPAHKLGQLIGNFIEKYFEYELTTICQNRGLYLDVVGTPRKARYGQKVTWVDVYGSKHDLDFVIERDGTDEQLGLPVALIECAWRRYTKHSKNKAQEIQGAVLPVAEKYKYHKPFLGAVIAGDFTKPSVEQLNSCGFSTVYFESKEVFEAFQEAGFDIFYDEQTSDDDATRMIGIFESLTPEQKRDIFSQIVLKTEGEVARFKKTLEDTLDRQVSTVVVAPMFGANRNFHTIDEAIEYLSTDGITEVPEDIGFMNLYVQMVYNNGDRIEGNFKSSVSAQRFLRGNAEI